MREDTEGKVKKNSLEVFMLSNDIELVDKMFADICHPEAIIDAWDRIKAALAEFGKSPNSQSDAIALL